MWFRLDENDLKLFEKLLEIADDDLRIKGARALRERLQKQIREDAADAPLIEQARELYAHGSDDDIEVDDDATFSRGDDGTWVMMWGWIRHPDEDEKEDDDEEEDAGEHPDSLRRWYEGRVL